VSLQHIFTAGISITKKLEKLEKVRKKVRNFYLDYQSLERFSNFLTFLICFFNVINLIFFVKKKWTAVFNNLSFFSKIFILIKNTVRKVRKLENASNIYPSMFFCLTFFSKTFG